MLFFYYTSKEQVTGLEGDCTEIYVMDTLFL